MIEQIAIAISQAAWMRDGSIPDHPEAHVYRAHVGEWAFPPRAGSCADSHRTWRG